MELHSLDSVFQSTDNHMCLPSPVFVASWGHDRRPCDRLGGLSKDGSTSCDLAMHGLTGLCHSCHRGHIFGLPRNLDRLTPFNTDCWKDQIGLFAVPVEPLAWLLDPS